MSPFQSFIPRHARALPQKLPGGSPPLIDNSPRQVVSAILSLTKWTEPSANRMLTPLACRLREAQVSVPDAADTQGRNGSLFGTDLQPWAAFGQRSGSLLFGPSSANRN